MWQEESVIRFTLRHPATREEAWTRFLRMAGHWPIMGFGWWAVEEKASARVVGEVGLLDYKREMQPSLEGKLEMGWGLMSGSEGKGYATEAGRGVIRWTEEHLPRQPLYCIIDPENGPSIRVAERLGFQETERSTYKDHAVILFRREFGSSDVSKR
jgi:RimJ/RimL family protein N-acetyltransferase